MSLSQEFDEAASKVSSGTLGNLSQNDQLDLYGLYAIVKKGAAPNKGPSAFLDPRGYAKWSAWSSQSYLQKDEAMTKYIELVTQHESTPTSEGDAASSGWDMFQDKAITGFDIVDDSNRGGEAKKDICLWATQGDVKSVKYCLDKEGVSVDFRDEDGLTALMRAVDRDHRDVVDVLVGAGADLDVADEEGQTALHYAAYCDYVEMAGLLVLYGASTEIEDNDGLTALQAATGETREAMQAAKEGTWKRSSPTNDDNSPTCCPKQINAISTKWQVMTGVSFLLVACLILRYRYKK